MAMQQSEKGRSLTQAREGLRLKAYQDPGGIWTIGYGHTGGVQAGQECSEAEAEAWYAADIAVAEHDVQLYVTVPLNQGQFDALVDWTFNLGGGSLRSSTMLKCLNNKDFSGALQNLLLWDMGHVQGKMQVIPALAERRAEEVKLWKGEI